MLELCQWRDFPRPITFRCYPYEITSFCIDNRLRQRAFFGKGGATPPFTYVEIFWKRKTFSLLCKTARFHVAVRLFRSRSQRTSKCGKNMSDTLGYASCATFLFLPHFDVICDLLLNRRRATWNLFIKHIYRSLFEHSAVFGWRITKLVAQ